VFSFQSGIVGIADLFELSAIVRTREAAVYDRPLIRDVGVRPIILRRTLGAPPVGTGRNPAKSRAEFIRLSRASSSGTRIHILGGRFKSGVDSRIWIDIAVSKEALVALRCSGLTLLFDVRGRAQVPACEGVAL
jgi:hypothetical protein